MSRRRRPVSPAPAVATAAEEHLSSASATCPVCLSVLIRPVTMPCRHTLCMPCFDATVEQAALSCPLCRTRISVWLRKTRRSGSLVDEKLWARLQREFPEKVQARLEGREADFSDEDLESAITPLLSAPGEIRREFEQQLEAVRDEEQERRSRSERASRELIDRLEQDQAEESRRRQEQERRDEELARGVMREEERLLSPVCPAAPVGNPPRAAGGGGNGDGRPRPPGSTPVRGPMDVYIGQFTPRVGGKRPVSPVQTGGAAETEPAPVLDSTPSPTGSGKENSDPASTIISSVNIHSPDSSDSIRAELRHFKPIRAAPRTPPKRRPDGVLGAPPVVHAVARFLDLKRDRNEARKDAPMEGKGARDGSKMVVTREVIDRGDGGGDSGEDAVGATSNTNKQTNKQDGGGAATAVKRQADVQSEDHRPPKRRPAAALTSGPPELEGPFLAPPPPQESAQAQESELEWDLESAELLEQQKEAERLLELELADRRLAERLQKELNTLPPVDRSKGSADAYSLREANGSHAGISGIHSGTSANRSNTSKNHSNTSRNHSAPTRNHSAPTRSQSAPSRNHSGSCRSQSRTPIRNRRKPAAGTSGRRQPGRRDRAQLSIQESLGRSARALSPEW